MSITVQELAARRARLSEAEIEAREAICQAARLRTEASTSAREWTFPKKA